MSELSAVGWVAVKTSTINLPKVKGENIMTKVSYDILFHGRKVKNVVGYQEACNIVAELGSGWRFKAVYSEYDPNRTPEYLEACKDCIYLQEKEWDEDNYINHFTLNHWTKCNCNCIYCYTKDNKKAFNSYKEYPLYPIIKDMFKKEIIKKTDESCIIFGGGEPTILKDFDKLIDLFLEKGCKNIRINSSGIKFSKSIAKGLKLGAISLVISTDAGCKETYEKIKEVKTYNKVWENIRKYAKAQGENNL